MHRILSRLIHSAIAIVTKFLRYYLTLFERKFQRGKKIARDLVRIRISLFFSSTKKRNLSPFLYFVDFNVITIELIEPDVRICTRLLIIIHNGRAAPCRKYTRLKESVCLMSVNACHGMKGMNTSIPINRYGYNVRR